MEPTQPASGRPGPRGDGRQRPAVLELTARASTTTRRRRSTSSACGCPATSSPAASRTRYEQQVAAGFLDEVRALLARPAGLSRTARQALGYRELLDHLEDGVALDEAVDRRRPPHAPLRPPPARVVPARPPHPLGRACARTPSRSCRPSCETSPDMHLSLTKHHGLGNDFLVAARPRRRPRRGAGPGAGACATGDRASGADGLIRARPDDEADVAHGAVQRRRQPGRDERQRHPLPRPGRRPRRGHRPELTVATDAAARTGSSVTPTEDPAVHEVRVDMGQVELEGRATEWLVPGVVDAAFARIEQPAPRAAQPGAGVRPRPRRGRGEGERRRRGRRQRRGHPHQRRATWCWTCSSGARAAPRPAAPVPAPPSPWPTTGAWSAPTSLVRMPGGVARVGLGRRS